MNPLSNKLFNTKFLLNFANSLFLYGLYLLGAFGRAARSAASPYLSSLIGLLKYLKLAEAIP